MSFHADKVETINGTFSLIIMAEDISNFGQELFISVFVTSKKTKSLGLYSSELSCFYIDFLLRKHILQKQSFQFYKVILFNFCICKAQNNSIDSDLEFCFKFKFCSSELIKLRRSKC